VTSHKQTTDGTDYTTAYTYKLNGALDEETYPSTRVVKNQIDANGDLSAVESKKTSSAGFWRYADTFTYNAAGAVTSMQFGNGLWEKTAFNSRLQPTQIGLGTTTGTTGLLQLDYSYGSTQNNGNVQTQTITVPGIAHPFVQNYVYDPLNRLQSATETNNSAQTWKQEFSYDRYGNRSFVTGTGHTDTLGSCTTMCNPSFDTSNNRINSTGYSFDSSGNTLTDPSGQNFTYDAENKQVLVTNSNGTVGQYWYDGDGKRVKKYVPATGETTVFVYDAAGKEIAEYSTIVASSTEAKVNYLTADHLGSPRINTDQNGAVTARHDYMPFGEEIGNVGGRSNGGDLIRKQFTGYERDGETDLNFAEARYYAKKLARFQRPDDFLNDTNVFEPDNWNLYAYVRNNPLTNTDPSGEEIDGTGLDDAQRQQLVDDWKKKTGYKSVYFDKKTNKLVVDTAAGFKKGSATARKELLSAATSTSKIFNLKATNGSSSVAFAQNVGTATSINATTGAKTETYDVNIDFDDFKLLNGDKAAKKAFSIGIVVIHEFEHGLHEGEATGSDSPSSPTDPGPLERTYINPIRSELGLAQRSTYYGVPQSTGKYAGFVELKFRDTKGKDRILRWQDSVVGGKHK